eukprot:383825_1
MASKTYKDNIQRKKTVLILGYIRCYFNKFIPAEISRICVQYLPLTIWTIKNNQELKKQILKKQSFWQSHEIQIGSKIKLYVYGIVFECRLVLSDHIVLDKEFFFTIHVISFPKAMQTINVYYEIYCNETNELYKGVDNISLLNLWAQRNHIRSSGFRVSDFRNKEFISFIVSLDLINIKYGMYPPLSDKNIFCKDIKMNKKIHYDWIIEGDLMNEFKCARPGKYFFSPNFGLDGNEIDGDNFAWCLGCNPGGIGSFVPAIGFSLQMLNMPPKVEHIVVNCILSSDYGNYSYTQKVSFSHDQDCTSCISWRCHVYFYPNDLKQLTSLKLSASIEIIAVSIHPDYIGYTNNTFYKPCKLLAESDWIKYGIS